MAYTCPVCGYPSLPAPPRDYEICPSCGTEFEYHDAVLDHAQLRGQWIRSGATWHSTVVGRPIGWNPYWQLLQAGMGWALPRYDVRTELDAPITTDGNVYFGAMISAA